MSAELSGTEAAIVNLNFEPVATTDGRLAGERGRQTRQRLLDATVELLSTTSWRSVKVTDIARQARTSPATFYQYFANVEEAIRVLAEGMVDEAAQLAELVGGDWSEGTSWDTALHRHRGLPGLLGGQPGRVPGGRPGHGGGRRELRGIRVRALNAVTVALSQVILAACPSTGESAGESTASPAGNDPMAVAGAIVAMFASVSAHRYGFEYWGIRTPHLIDTQARLLHWAVTGREAEAAAPLAATEVTLSSQLVGRAAPRRRRAT